VGPLSPVDAGFDVPPGPMVVDAKVTPTVVADWLHEAFRFH
jgi:hypothetical protein